MDVYTIYSILVGVLFLLAISDLVVGVSNDAVNFLVSAIGSKAAPFWVIMIIASVGILFGVTFSDGMMEVARKSIFHPDKFMFSEIMILFLAVMLTDIILLDTFNTLGLPTSTTVSIVFELLGAAVAVSLLKMSASGEAYNNLGSYINTNKAILIIFGILLSVVVAFSVGALVQYIARLFFSFQYEKSYKYFGAIWGGVAVTAITYFILIKGAKGASFMNEDMKILIKENALSIIFYAFIGWTVLLQLLHWFFKFNILKFTVLVGTFALAMAFAGNDLVNFIGVPLAGLESYKSFVESGANNPEMFSMGGLSGKVKTQTTYLLIAGMIMVLTLWLSKKAKTVTETSVNLSRQDSGDERFGSSLFARAMVRSAINFSTKMEMILPKQVNTFLSSRFDNVEKTKTDEEASAFDLIRASVNLVVASVLIAFATSLKLPLSTTYVTFMVAMGTSLADGAWGRESAVYRITGVITVIGGWFFTAFVAFTVSFLIASLIFKFGLPMVFVVLAIAVFIIVRSKVYHKKHEQEKQEDIDEEEIKDENVFEKSVEKVTKTFSTIKIIYKQTIEGLAKEDRKLLKKTHKEVMSFNKKAKHMKDHIDQTILKLNEDSIETAHYYVQVVDYLREIGHAIMFVTRPAYEHIENNHKPLVEEQIADLRQVSDEIADMLSLILRIIKKERFEEVADAIDKKDALLALLAKLRKNQIKRIKNNEVGTKNSMLYLGMLNESKNLVLYSVNLLKSQRDFIIYQES